MNFARHTYFYSSSNNIIYSNIISSCRDDAFYIWCSSGNEIHGNEISGSGKGFEIWIYSSGNSIYRNNITNNNKGVYIYYPGYTSSSNLFYHNNFIENSENNTWDECTNNWYNETLEEGNYYDDYEGTDGDGDGIGDVPYNISGGTNKDLYPLMELYAENKPPVASFTYSPENPVVNERIIFNASDSFDPDGNITAYEWEFGDGANGTGEIVNHSYSLEGNYTVNLTVADNDGATNSTYKIVNVSAIPNKPPVAYFTFSPLNPVVDERITFNASLSFDTDGNITAYEWEFGDGGNATGEVVNYSYSSAGNYTVNLTVTDDDGATNCTSKIVNVSAIPNKPPVAYFTYSPLNPVVDETIIFNASLSFDTDGNITAYEWEFGDGANGTGGVMEHCYSSAGNYTVNLTVTDDNGATNSTSKIVNVSAIPNKPPVANFTYSPENPVIDETIIFNASLSFDTDGNITAYEWEFGDGANGTGEGVNYSYSSAGNYTVNLTVTDDDGAINSTYKIVNVTEKVIFDTGKGTYPSIFGTHNGTITPYKDIYVERMFTYPCAGTGGHTEYVRIWENGLDVNATWGGYSGDWRNVTFDEAFVLKANLTYNYTIRTGSYPQIHHIDELEVDNGVITCEEFIDANGRRYDNWILAIKLE